jgi:hypothetical protein
MEKTTADAMRKPRKTKTTGETRLYQPRAIAVTDISFTSPIPSDAKRLAAMPQSKAASAAKMEKAILVHSFKIQEPSSCPMRVMGKAGNTRTFGSRCSRISIRASGSMMARIYRLPAAANRFARTSMPEG